MINVYNDCLLFILQNGLIFIFSKLFDLYIKRSISIKNIDITSIAEQAALDNAESLCLLFGITNSSANRSRTVDISSSFSQSQFSALSTGDSSKYDEQQERKEQALRSTVSAIRAKHGDCSLEFVEQDMSKEIDVGKRIDESVENDVLIWGKKSQK